MFDEHSLQSLNAVLRAVVAVVVIIASIVATLYHLRKLAPGWPRNVFPLVAALSPALFNIAGMVALILSNYYLLAGGLFSLGFLVEAIRFVRDATPLDRKAVVGFGISCCSFVLSISMVFLVRTISSVLGALEHMAELAGRQTEAIAGLLEILKKLPH